MSSVYTIGFVILSMVCLTTNSQDFCESYQRNGFRVIIINEFNSEFVFMVIDKNFWTVRAQNKFDQISLYFDPLDRQAVNPSEQFLEPNDEPKGNYSFAFVANSSADPQLYYVFHKVLKIIFSLKANNISVNNS